MPRYDRTLADDLAGTLKTRSQQLFAWIKGPGRSRASILAARVLDRLRLNLTARRFLSFPHLVVVFWIVILLWGERWVFDSKVSKCDWDHWEDWVSFPVLSPKRVALNVCQLLTRLSDKRVAPRSEPPSPHLRCRPSDHRPSQLPRPPLAPLLPHLPHNRQLPTTGLQGPREAPAPRLAVLPRRPLRRRPRVEDGAGRVRGSPLGTAAPRRRGEVGGYVAPQVWPGVLAEGV